MKIHTVTGSTIKLGKFGAFSLQYVMECGRDWVAEIRIVDGGNPKTPKRARVFVSQNPDVALLMNLAHRRGELEIK